MLSSHLVSCFIMFIVSPAFPIGLLHVFSDTSLQPSSYEANKLDFAIMFLTFAVSGQS